MSLFEYSRNLVLVFTVIPLNFLAQAQVHEVAFLREPLSEDYYHIRIEGLWAIWLLVRTKLWPIRRTEA